MQALQSADASALQMHLHRSGSGRTVCMVKTHKTARVQFVTTQQFVKSGQIRDARPKTGQIGVPGDFWFFPGLEVKNRDCPGKSGTYGHLMNEWLNEWMNEWIGIIIALNCMHVCALKLDPQRYETSWFQKNFKPSSIMSFITFWCKWSVIFWASWHFEQLWVGLSLRYRYLFQQFLSEPPCQHNRHTTQPDCVTLCPLYSGCGRTLVLLCAAVGCRLTNYQALHAMKLSCYAENVAFRPTW